MSTAITTQSPGQIAEQVAIAGDLSKLSPEQRMSYYGEVCRSLGLNPLTRPFQYITLNGKLTLYTTRDATDQLRRLHNVSISIVGRERVEDVYVVTARATAPDGRSDESTGVVSIGSLKGDNLANALMKAETKAKRRVTMSICGLGWMDESELETVRDARPVRMDAATGDVLPALPPAPTELPPTMTGVITGEPKSAFNAQGQLYVQFTLNGDTYIVRNADAELQYLEAGDVVTVVYHFEANKKKGETLRIVNTIDGERNADGLTAWEQRHSEGGAVFTPAAEQQEAAPAAA